MRIDDCTARLEAWPLATPFRIARDAKSEATIVSVELKAGRYTGRGECCPYARYGESVDGIIATLNTIDLNTFGASDLGGVRQALLSHLPPGSARNALDCALWDLEAKSRGVPVWQLANLAAPRPLMTCFTLSLDTPDAMAAAAREHAKCPQLKLKLGEAALDQERMQAVRRARPDARLMCDANEGWLPQDLEHMLSAAHDNGLELIEQPLPSAADTILHGLSPAVPICADEAAAPATAISALTGRYQAVNIKLDKTGGLTAAIAMICEARDLGLKIMIGSMVSTSLSMAPAALIGSLADWVDLDSPLLLARDRPHAMTITAGMLSVPSPELWG